MQSLQELRKKRRKHDKIVLPGKTKLANFEFLIFKVLIDKYFSHDEFVSVNRVLREHNQKTPEFLWNTLDTVDSHGILWLNKKYIEEV